MELNSWKERLHDVTGKLVNERVKEILSSIKDFDSSSINEDEYFRVLAAKMNDLSGLKLHFEELEGKLIAKSFKYYFIKFKKFI